MKGFAARLALKQRRKTTQLLKYANTNFMSLFSSFLHLAIKTYRGYITFISIEYKGEYKDKNTAEFYVLKTQLEYLVRNSVVPRLN